MPSPAPPAEGPGPVAWAHRLTIATALLGALAYAAWELASWLDDGGPGAGVRSALGLGVAVGFGFYLRQLRTRLAAKLTRRR